VPLAYEMFPGNMADETTLRGMLQLIGQRYGQAERIWVMDRGVPTEAVLAELRQSEAKVSFLVGTPKGRLTKLEQALAEKPWQEVRPQLRVKLLPQAGKVWLSNDRTASRIDVEPSNSLNALANSVAAISSGTPVGSRAALARTYDRRSSFLSSSTFNSPLERLVAIVPASVRANSRSASTLRILLVPR
jgi:hypothetical protein